jgi:hypothetical protein
VKVLSLSSNYNWGGIYLGDGTKTIQFVVKYDSAVKLDVCSGTGTTTCNIAHLAEPTLATPATVTWIYLQVQNDGTNLKWNYSFDGTNFFQVYSGTVGAVLGTISRVGLNVGVFNSTVASSVSYQWFRRTQ